MSTDPSDNLDQDCSASSYLSDVEAPQSPVHPGTSAQTPGGGSACTTNVCTTESHPISGNISIMELAQNPNFLSHTRNSHDMPLVSPMQWLNGVKIPTALTTSTNDHQRKRKYMMRGGYEERLVNLLIREKSDHAIWAHGLRREDNHTATERNPSLYVEVYHVKETYGSIICRCRLLPLDAINEKATHIDLPPLEDEFIDILLCMELDPSHSTLASRHSTQPDHAIHVGDLLKIYKPYQEFTFGSSSILDDWEIPRNGLIVTRFVVRSSDVSDRDKPI
ncbi:hypothetical protein K493DRAFT_311103 [Basidiobolus meristosporus CBS 931.73]|uniref:DUF4502 domain-containing protein n=1 Tax=Basidiobolus meristosporus CBS 931.73 TaxID=1314790 RepID=A0A1Y1Z4D3_9FUNG|nr:hypothetical protein K493DRAFT_321478 [Basidiobolus meristosporus CBS 931.73]ORY05110.1 hypothetical protein K493DRAFT_311103 [Basidiobolus meristosporus CBS 931.73]|eukprot:ORX76927.1 hypothetical protein K493DRAFT_321478 [Basidiobolus meristosporus CBS 931.73]